MLQHSIIVDNSVNQLLIMGVSLWTLPLLFFFYCEYELYLQMDKKSITTEELQNGDKY